MRTAKGLLIGIAALALASAAGAAGPYDGTYAGTSLTFTGTTGGGKGNACTTAATAPSPLTIANGHAQTKWGNGMMDGDVGPDGKLAMHSGSSGRFDGQIDASGTLKGSYQGYCIYALTWQRQR